MANPDAHYRTTGPEVWKQTQGKVTHFFASTGTCGTISGTGKFLKAVSGNRVKIHGIYPETGHDIPGVRSIPQLKMTDHFKPDCYDGLVEVSNAEAFDMCIRLNREESLIAGPSSGMQVVGALKTIKDEPGNVGVVIFCDDIFKYTTSVTRHCPSIFTSPSSMLPAEVQALNAVMEITKDGPDTVTGAALAKLGNVIEKGGSSAPLVIDVRVKEDFDTRLRVRGAVNVPMANLTGQSQNGDDVVRLFDIPGAVQKKPQENGTHAAPQPYSTVLGALKAAMGRDVSAEEPMLLVCNRGIDSLTSLLVLKGAGFKAVQHVDRGMFAWKEAGLPLDSGPGQDGMPPAATNCEENLLKRLGYDREGKPVEF